MMRRTYAFAFCVGFICALLAFGAGRATALTVVGAPEGSPFQAWADASLAPDPMPVVDMTFGAPAVVTTTAPATIHWYAAGTAYEEIGHATFMHELGHVWEINRLAGRHLARLRYRFARLLRPGYTKEYRRTRLVPRLDWDAYFDEQFAMGYSYCALGMPGASASWFGFGYTPTAAVQARVCAMIAARS